MIVEIAAPVFKCRDDEAIFFSRLSEVTGYEGVVGKGLNLYLTIAENNKETVFRELQAICDVWNTSFRVSQPS